MKRCATVGEKLGEREKEESCVPPERERRRSGWVRHSFESRFSKEGPSFLVKKKILF